MSKFPPINGKEIQLDGFQIAFHDDDEIKETQEKTLKALQRVFRGESAHKIIRISYQRGSKSFLFNAGFHEEMYNEVMTWMEEIIKREYYPLVFEFRNFVTYDPPSIV